MSILIENMEPAQLLDVFDKAGARFNKNGEPIQFECLPDNKNRLRVEFCLSNTSKEIKWSHNGVHWYSAQIESLIQAYEQQIKYLIREQENE